MTTTKVKNADYWRQYGEYVLMAMPYADEVLVEGRGCTVIDADGNELLDLASGMFCCVLGHNHPEFIRRVVRQTEALLHTGRNSCLLPFSKPAISWPGWPRGA